jgi:hypothetical protein
MTTDETHFLDYYDLPIVFLVIILLITSVK